MIFSAARLRLAGSFVILLAAQAAFGQPVENHDELVRCADGRYCIIALPNDEYYTIGTADFLSAVSTLTIHYHPGRGEKMGNAIVYKFKTMPSAKKPGLIREVLAMGHHKPDRYTPAGLRDMSRSWFAGRSKSDQEGLLLATRTYGFHLLDASEPCPWSDKAAARRLDALYPALVSLQDPNFSVYLGREKTAAFARDAGRCVAEYSRYLSGGDSGMTLGRSEDGVTPLQCGKKRAVFIPDELVPELRAGMADASPSLYCEDVRRYLDKRGIKMPSGGR